MSDTAPSPTSPTHSAIVASSPAIAEATERRVHQQAPVRATSEIAAEYEKRLYFRRLLDPGIMRPNAYETAMASLKTLLKIAENLLREPDNPKFQRFKPTNSTIKRHLVEPKGALEYAIALGFGAEVVDFQPYYVFNKRKMPDLRIGAAILQEFVELETAKREHAEKLKREEKAAAEAAANKVKLAFFDDRKARAMYDEREKERREARAALTAQEAAAPSSPKNMPNPVHVSLADPDVDDESIDPDDEDGEDVQSP